MLFYYLFNQDPHIVKRRAGEFLFQQGEAGEHMYVLARGDAEILLGDKVVEDAGIGAIVGEMAVIEPGPRSASVRARGDCEFVEIDQNRFDYLVSQTPQFATRVMRIMATRLRKADTLLKTH
ncbi:MAG: cyclic nucleotide-binding domain-containing protein [Rhodocyclaceae bacterium]|nr:MAG: cyclic nucleotide-binding domain-containing protein [Rhodocyclaceae bacterium]